jgi:hypothetical protein
MSVRGMLSSNDHLSFDGALVAARRQLAELSGAIATLRYWDAWMAAGCLRLAVEHAQDVLNALPLDQRADPATRLHGLRVMAAPVLALAPHASRRTVAHSDERRWLHRLGARWVAGIGQLAPATKHTGGSP